METFVYIIFRRAYEQDDFDYGSYEPVLITLNKERANIVFTNIFKSIVNSGAKVDTTETTFEYKRKSWCYQYKIETYTLDRFQSKFKDIKDI